jgi:hypothetical protein
MKIEKILDIKVVPQQSIETKILVIRGKKVMKDVHARNSYFKER